MDVFIKMLNFMFIEYGCRLGFLRLCNVCSFCLPYYSPQERLDAGFKLWIQTSLRKSDLIHKLSGQIPKVFSQHDTAGRAIKYSGINLLKDVTANFFLNYVSFMVRGIPYGHAIKISRPTESFQKELNYLELNWFLF